MNKENELELLKESVDVYHVVQSLREKTQRTGAAGISTFTLTNGEAAAIVLTAQMHRLEKIIANNEAGAKRA